MLLLPIILWWADAPMRFGVGRTRRIVCSVNLWSIAIVAILSSQESLADDRLIRDDAGANAETMSEMAAPPLGSRPETQRNMTLVREGTLIPPTSGKVVMAGRRWAFVPATPAAANADLRIETSPRSLLGPTRLVATADVASESAAFSSGRPLPQFILTENLGLQRIVEAIRLDPSDDQWTLSGEVMEFFRENSLTIRTAQRSNAK